jgi:hypothetical protein
MEKAALRAAFFVQSGKLAFRNMAVGAIGSVAAAHAVASRRRRRGLWRALAAEIGGSIKPHGLKGNSSP